MNKPFLSQIEAHMARPFRSGYCDRWNIKYDKDENYEYGNSVLWMGSFYKNSLRAVAGLYVNDNLPGELFVYGFYGDGSKYQALPIRALIALVEDMPYNHKYGYIVADNALMLKTCRKFGWDIEENGMLPDGREIVKAGKYGPSSR